MGEARVKGHKQMTRSELDTTQTMELQKEGEGGGAVQPLRQNEKRSNKRMATKFS